MIQFTAEATGSKSARLQWDPTQQPTGQFQVYRSLDNIFGNAVTVGSRLSAGTVWFNDYSLNPATNYWYWLQDQNAVASGPQEITTQAAIVDIVALDETQMDALYDWAYTALAGLIPVSWKYQPSPQDLKPKVELNVLLVRRPGFNDDLRDANESLTGARIATISVNVSSDPQQPSRGVLNVVSLGSGTYTVTVDGTGYSVTYGSAPASATVVMKDIQAKLEAAGFTANLYGVDPLNQGLIIENQDPRLALTLTASVNLTASIYKPPKAMAIAQQLVASLGQQSLRDALSAAGIGVGTVEDPRDLTVMLDVSAELRAQFDFFINLANVKAVSGPIIDTIQSLNGTYN